MLSADVPTPTQLQEGMYWHRYKRAMVLLTLLFAAIPIAGFLIISALRNSLLQLGLEFLVPALVVALMIPVERSFRCPICSSSFQILRLSRRHHTPGHCEQCGATFRRPKE